MATDVALVLENLLRFHDFRGRSVIHVGAGGGQFIGYASHAAHVIAVDPDHEAMTRLRAAVSAAGIDDRFTLLEQPFDVLSERADLVFFEFCLHEVEDPAAALRHARELAGEIVVLDHAPESQWAWYVDETEKAERSWAAVERAGIRCDRRYQGWQRFEDVGALVEKVRPQGEVAINRALVHDTGTAIEIPMTYRIALL